MCTPLIWLSRLSAFCAVSGPPPLLLTQRSIDVIYRCHDVDPLDLAQQTEYILCFLRSQHGAIYVVNYQEKVTVICKNQIICINHIYNKGDSSYPIIIKRFYMRMYLLVCASVANISVLYVTADFCKW